MVNRISWTESASDRRPEATRGAADRGRLPAERDDVRELLEAAGLQLEGGYAGAAARRDEGGSGQFPLVMIHVGEWKVRRRNMHMYSTPHVFVERLPLSAFMPYSNDIFEQ